MLFAAMTFAGIIAFPSLPVSLVPSDEYPALSVIIEYPGIDPDKIETLITCPVERIVKTVSGIKEIQSVSEEGKSRVNLTFEDGTDIKIAALNVREKVGLISDSFPGEVQEPVVLRFDPSERPVVIAAIDIKGLSPDEIRDYADRIIKPALQRIEGVSEVNIAGGLVREIHIEADRGKVEARSIFPDEIAAAVKTGNVSMPGGIVETEKENRFLHIPSGFRSLREIEDSVLFSEDNRFISLKEAALVRFASRDREDYSRFNGAEYVTVYIHKGAGANSLEVCNGSVEVLSSLIEADCKIIYNQAEYIDSALFNAAFSGLWGIIIVIIIIAVFFRERSSILPVALSIPASMAVVPFFLAAGGKGINIMSLSGFALAVGMVVDNSIVIIERIKALGDTSVEGVLAAVNSVKLSLIASTTTTAAIFLPLIFFSKSAARTYGDMAYTVTWALFISLFTAIAIIPAFYLTFNKRVSCNHSVKEKGFFYNIINRINLYTLKLEGKIFGFYKDFLKAAFTRKKFYIYSGAILFFISMIIFSTIKHDTASDMVRGEFYAYLEFPTGFSLEHTDKYSSQVEDLVRGYNGVESVSAKTEKWRGTLTVKVSKKAGADEGEKIREKLKKDGDAILKPVGGFVFISEADEMSSREITVHFTGNNYDTLKKIARDASSRLTSAPGVRECLLRFREGRPMYTLAVNRERCTMSGVSHASIAENLRTGLFGPVITKFIEHDHEVDVRLRYGKRDSIDEIMAGTVKSINGAVLKISGLTDLYEGEGPTRNYRFNSRRSVSVTAKTEGVSMEEAELSIKKALSRMSFPEEYSWEFDSSITEYYESRRSLVFSVILSLLLIYMLLASLFESLSLPFIIMITLPLGLTVLAPLFYIFSIPFSSSVYMGFIVLAGIVVNNGIILADSLHKDIGGKKLSNDQLEEAIKATAISRFRPVLITVCTTVLGMLPLLFSSGEGAGLWRPFALTVCAGLAGSTLLTLVLLPLVFFYYYRGSILTLKSAQRG